MHQRAPRRDLQAQQARDRRQVPRRPLPDQRGREGQRLLGQPPPVRRGDHRVPPRALEGARPGGLHQELVPPHPQQVPQMLRQQGDRGDGHRLRSGHPPQRQLAFRRAGRTPHEDGEDPSRGGRHPPRALPRPEGSRGLQAAPRRHPLRRGPPQVLRLHPRQGEGGRQVEERPVPPGLQGSVREVDCQA